MRVEVGGQAGEDDAKRFRKTGDPEIWNCRASAIGDYNRLEYERHAAREACRPASGERSGTNTINARRRKRPNQPAKDIVGCGERGQKDAPFPTTVRHVRSDRVVG